jgi:hypothetical protein
LSTVGGREIKQEYFGKRFSRPNALESLAVISFTALGLLKGGVFLTIGLVGVSVVVLGAGTSLHKWRLQLRSNEIELRNRWVTMRVDVSDITGVKKKGFRKINEAIEIRANKITVTHAWSRKIETRQRIEIPDVFSVSLKVIEEDINRN